ncbi:MAG: GWxTD domain-containing protein [candidate division Zixibacteria bacterium]|nr:GWxTD domain-containing protein [candidate division Zixibacteria bacterium]
MFMKICLTVLFMLSVSPIQPGVAQPLDVNLTVYGGSIFFNNPEYDSVVLVEFPFTLNRNEFSFFRPDSSDTNYFARIFAQINLFNTQGMVIDSNKTYFSAMIPGLESASITGYKLFNKLSLLLKPGVYSARLTVIDAVSKKEGQFFYDRLVVEPPVKKQLAIGAVTLAYNIKWVGDNPTDNSLMVTNGFKVLNCPLSIFSSHDTSVYLYAEIYNLEYSPEVPSQYRLTYQILTDSNRVFMNYGSREKDKPGSSAVVTEMFDIKGWLEGIYTIQLTATDLQTQQSDTTLVPFRIFTPLSSRTFTSGGISSADPYDSLSLEEKVNLVAYLLTPTQKHALDNLNEQGKLNFLDQYWKEHDENISTGIIENRLKMIERYRFSNQYFSIENSRQEGWKTDRGRIYMTYGPWEEKEEISAPVLGNPYVIWYYHSLKEGKLFVFEDREGYGDYRLVHSNVYGEIYSDEWKQRLEAGSTELY